MEIEYTLRKVIVKGLSVDPAFPDKLADRDLGQGFVPHLLFQGGGQHFFRIQGNGFIFHIDHLLRLLYSCPIKKQGKADSCWPPNYGQLSGFYSHE